jgi:hypothetical protein
MLLLNVNSSTSASPSTASLQSKPWLDILDDSFSETGQIPFERIYSSVRGAVAVCTKLDSETVDTVDHISRRQVGLGLLSLMCNAIDAEEAGKTDTSAEEKYISKAYCVECTPYMFSCLLHLLRKLSNTITSALHSGTYGL